MTMFDFDWKALYRRHWVWRTSRRRDFYGMAAGFIGDGKPVFDTLQVFEERWRKIKDPRAETIAEMMAEMRGKNKANRALRFGEAASHWAPSIEAMAIDAGEQSGDIANGLRMAARLAETQNTIASTIKGELIYPGFLILMLVGLLYMLKTAVIPVFAEISPRHMWPASARLLGWIADNSGLLTFGLVATLIGGGAIFSFTKGRWTGESRDLADRFLPPWSVYRQVAGAIVMTCFAAFIRAGVPFSAIISQMSRTASDWERAHFDLMKAKMRRGIPDAEALAGPLYDEQIRWEIAIYGGMSDFAKSLESLATRTTDAALANIKMAAGVARLLIMIAVAGMIVWVYGTFFTIVMSARAVT